MPNKNDIPVGENPTGKPVKSESEIENDKMRGLMPSLIKNKTLHLHGLNQIKIPGQKMLLSVSTDVPQKLLSNGPIVFATGQTATLSVAGTVVKEG